MLGKRRKGVLFLEFMTNDRAAHEQLLYFTSSSLSADDTQLYYLSDAGGSPNVYVKNIATGAVQKCTDNAGGAMKSYVYFRGVLYAGLAKASMSLDAARNVLYYIQDQCVMRSDADGRIRVLRTLPQGQMTAFTHVSADGRFLCVPTTDERALEDEDGLPRTFDGCGGLNHDIDLRVQNEGLHSTLRVVDTETGEEVLAEDVPRAWITHVQFSPVDAGAILYNHEWPADCGIRRMWLYRDGRHLRLREEAAGRSRADWTCHEMWYPDGASVLYHGGYAGGAYYVGRVSTQGGDNQEVALPADFTAYGHFTMGNLHPDWLVSDGYYAQEGQSGYISILRMDWAAGTQHWVPLCLHRSPWTTQDSHPHPIFDHADRFVYFTGFDGEKLKVCRVAVPDSLAERG